MLVMPADAQNIRQANGADARVNYADLARLGPWDDRNYRLKQQDLQLLAPDEHLLSEAIPAFYRVQLRRQYSALLREGKAQYPRSALPRFFVQHGGYQIEGKVYRRAQREANGRWYVLREHPVAMVDEDGQLRSLEGDVRITDPQGAAESSIEASPVDPQILVAGSNGPGSGQQMHYSTDGGASWSESAALPLGGTCCDPTIAWSSDGAFAYTATLGSQNYFYRSADNGQTWDDLANEPGNDPRREISAGGFVDKEFLHVDHSPDSPFQDNIYLTWHESNIMRFARSSDFGQTWSSVLSFPATNAVRGIGSDITTDAAGNVYYFWPAFNSQQIYLAKSTNGGQSFGTQQAIATTEGSFIFPVPSIESREVFIYVAADVDRSDGPYADSIYASWTDSTAATSNNANNNHARIQVAYSRDGGASWEIVTPHAMTDANQVDRWHQWLAVDPSGRVHLIFYDTSGDATRSSVNLYYTHSNDGAQSWSTPQRLTEESSPNINDSFEFGDYNGLAATLDSVIAVYTDNRQEQGGGGDSVDVYASGISTNSGADSDADGVADASDNCTQKANPAQSDADSDGIGDMCDGDFNNDCEVNFSDLAVMKTLFFSTSPLADLDGSGSVDFADLSVLRTLFFAPPGPSGQTNACDQP